MSKLPTSKLSRSSLVARTVAKAGAQKLGAMAKSAIIPTKDKEAVKELSDEEIAKTIFKALGRLKGTALKAAQMLTMEVNFLPDYLRKELAKSCYQAPGINKALVRKIIQTQFQTSPEKLFVHFDSEPFAAASLGQVHGAVDKQGRELAVKIQYPGIADTIKSDVTMLKAMLKMAPARFELGPVIPEIEKRLLEETDYIHEAEQTLAFANEFKLAGIKIAQPVTEYCTDKVLTTERLPGLHLDTWLESNPDKEKRNRVAQHLADLFIYSLYNISRLHADPNIGNFLIMQDQQIGLLDFGCTQPLDTAIRENFILLFKAYRRQDIDKVTELFTHYYMHGDHPIPAEISQNMVQPLVNWMSQIFHPNGFDFGENPDFMKQGMELALKAHKVDKMPVKPNKQVLFIERTFFGYLQIFQQLGAYVLFDLDKPQAALTITDDS